MDDADNHHLWSRFFHLFLHNYGQWEITKRTNYRNSYVVQSWTNCFDKQSRDTFRSVPINSLRKRSIRGQKNTAR